MSKENLAIWDALKSPPQSALTQIAGGRLKGYTDISPQWRLFAMTERFGVCGIGWKYTIDRQWIEAGEGVEKCAFVNISLYIKVDGEWSAAIPGTGGSSFVTMEKNGPYTSDEAYKMATTDALSVAMKEIGVAADIYSGGNDYTKYTSPKTARQEKEPDPKREALNAKIVKTLQDIFGDDPEAKKATLVSLTTWEKDGKTIQGKPDYRTFSDKQAEIVLKKLTEMAANASDKSDEKADLWGSDDVPY